MTPETKNLIEATFIDGKFVPKVLLTDLEEGDYIIHVAKAKKAINLSKVFDDLEKEINFEDDEVEDFLENRR